MAGTQLRHEAERSAQKPLRNEGGRVKGTRGGHWSTHAGAGEGQEKEQRLDTQHARKECQPPVEIRRQAESRRRQVIVEEVAQASSTQQHSSMVGGSTQRPSLSMCCHLDGKKLS